MSRRVVTFNDGSGRSSVLATGSDGTPFRWGSVVWPLSPAGAGSTALSPGEVRWAQYTLPTDEELDAYVAQTYGAGHHAGMHTTSTIDFVQVLEGRVALVLDTETVELGAGDVVVQQATAHAWRVLEPPVRLSTLMIGLRPADKL